jgi:hypothetical protein
MGISVLYVRISSLDGKTDRQRVNEEEFDRVSYKDYKGQFKIIVDNMPSKEICHLVLNQRTQKIEFEKDSFELMKVSAEEIAKHKKRIVEEAMTHLLN